MSRRRSPPRATRPLRHRLLGLLTDAALLWLAGAVAPVGAWAQGPPGMVYVQSNAPENSILTFVRGASGRLTPFGEVPAGGRGVTPTIRVGPFDSDQNLIADPDRGRLFSVNGGSNTIAVFDIMPDGGLMPVPGSPFPSGGINPVSVGLADNILAVVNMNDDELQDPRRSRPNYTTFRVTPLGGLAPVPGSTVEVPNGSQPSQALTSRDGELLFGADFAFGVPPGFGIPPLDRGVLRSFRIRANGRLVPADSRALPDSAFGASAARRLPLGLQVHPGGRVLYVGFVTFNALGVYAFDASGTLTFVRALRPAGDGICWFVTDAEGTRLYSANNFDNTVSVFDISRPSEPVLLQSKLLALGQRVPPPGVTQIGAAAPFQLAIDPGGAYLHVVTQRAFGGQQAEANALHVLPILPDGTLGTQAEFLVLPSSGGSRPQGLVAF